MPPQSPLELRLLAAATMLTHPVRYAMPSVTRTGTTGNRQRNRKRRATNAARRRNRR